VELTMTDAAPKQFDNVSVLTLANVYFQGKVVSHTVHLPDGAKKTLGVVLPGSFHFSTAAPERMDIVAGTCRVKLANESEWRIYGPGTHFEVAANSAFDITVDSGHADYICSFG
jgi:purine/pyrimidine-nucleoside phosphorylase